MVRRRVICGLVIAAAAAGVGCNDHDSIMAGDRHFIMTVETMMEPTGERSLGGGCTAVTEGARVGLGGGSAASDGPRLSFAVTIERMDDGARVIVTGGNDSIERTYDESWLRGEKPADTIEVALDAEHTYRVRLSGGLTCELPNQ